MAALILLFGQPVARIRRLTAADVSTDDTGVMRLRLGRTPIEVPAPLDDLIRRLPDNRREGMAAVAPDDSGWLFPGSRPGQPLRAC